MNASLSSANQVSNSFQLVDFIGKVFIIAYKEPTQQLEEVLKKEGFHSELILAAIFA